jgi:dCMP deaminase
MAINWDEYFMGIALLSAHRSKDPNTKVGTCIVNDDKKIVAVGYNGMPRGCNDNDFPWGRDGEYVNQKYPYVVHAELNAILNSTCSLKNCTLYTALFPCNECCKAIIQSGIKKVFYLSGKYNETPQVIVAKKMLDAAGVQYVQIKSELKSITISYSELNV